eukprot:13247007-Heterocapsa_arctica.AAC.1
MAWKSSLPSICFWAPGGAAASAAAVRNAPGPVRATGGVRPRLNGWCPIPAKGVAGFHERPAED